MMLTLVRSGKTYFSESRAPELYGSTNKRRMAFIDLLCTFTLMFSRMSEALWKGITFSRCTWSYANSLPLVYSTTSFVSQRLAADHLVFELDVGQLVFQFCLIRAFDHLQSLRQRHFKREVVVQRLRVENTVVGQDLVVQPDLVLGPVDIVQFIFSFYSQSFLVPCFRSDLAQIFALDTLEQYVVALFLLEEQIFEDFEDVIASRVLDDGPHKFYHHLADKGPRDVLHEEVVGMAARKDDVEAKRQRAGHMYAQRLAGVGFRSVKGDAFDRAGGLHGAQGLAAASGSERLGHFGHGIKL